MMKLKLTNRFFARRVMGEVFLHDIFRPVILPVASALALKPLMALAPDEDPIECDQVKRHGCAFWRGNWLSQANGHEARITAREFGHGGPGYCFFEMRCVRTRTRTGKQDWYLNWRSFTPARGMRLIADYRSHPGRPGIVAIQEAKA